METTCAPRGTTPDESPAKAPWQAARQEHVMSLRNRQKKQLRRIASDLRRSDAHLSAMFNVFGKLYPDQDMPAWEQVPRESSSRGPLTEPPPGLSWRSSRRQR
jgi:hypothetical protein